MRTGRRAELLGRLIASGVAGGVALGSACMSLQPPDPPATAGSVAADAEVLITSGEPEAAGALRPGMRLPLISDPNVRIMGNVQDPSSAQFCDPDQWPRLEAVLEEIREGEVLVDEAIWVNQSASFQRGAALWMSRCSQENRAVEIRGGKSEKPLAVYDPRQGFRTVE